MREVRLEEITTVSSGQGAPQGDSSYSFDEGIPFIKAGDMDFLTNGGSIENIQKVEWDVAEENKLTEFPKGSIVFAKSGMSAKKNRVYCLDADSYVVNHLAIIEPNNKEFLSGFLSYYLQFYKPSKLIRDEGYPSIRISDIRKLKIPLPTLSEQKAIVAKLDRAQRLIDIDKEMLAKYDELIQSVFLEMFGDPVRNEKGLLKKKIKDIGEVVTGNTPPKKNPENYGSDIEWVKTTNIVDEKLYPTKAEEFLSEKGKKIGRIIPKNSLIICCIAGSLSSIGKCSIVDRKIAINQQINAIVPNTEIIDTTFLYAQFLVGKKLIQDASTKSMKGMVSKSKFQKIGILVPDINSQKEFSDLFSIIGKEKRNLRLASKKSEELFSSLVKKSFN